MLGRELPSAASVAEVDLLTRPIGLGKVFASVGLVTLQKH
jgi:hypothetical protein